MKEEFNKWWRDSGSAYNPAKGEELCDFIKNLCYEAFLVGEVSGIKCCREIVANIMETAPYSGE